MVISEPVDHLTFKPLPVSKLTAAFYSLPDIDQLISIKGMVIRCSAVTPELKYAFFKCLVCGHSPDLVHAEKGAFPRPLSLFF
jgi:DNA replicative helicase MCM subunit Mcm2 (Cdc46/Mcm family)